MIVFNELRDLLAIERRMETRPLNGSDHLNAWPQDILDHFVRILLTRPARPRQAG
jgi:hypothetical protein